MEIVQQAKPSYRYVIGIDEAGRGPLAGPIAVGAVLAPISFDLNVLKGIRDSKKISLPVRERWFDLLRQLKKSGHLSYRVTFVSAEVIDRRGLTFATRKAIYRCLKYFGVSAKECLVLLDGGLRAPAVYSLQQTIIGGDDSEPLISLAAVAAKVTRDRRMTRLSRKYPMYDFEVHKGYATKEHYQKIRRHGISPLHRKSFLRKFSARYKLSLSVDSGPTRA